MAGGAGAPVDHFGFVDLEAMVRMGLEAGGFADGAADVFGLAAGTADEVVMVVPDAVFVACRRIGGLDAADDAFVREDVQDVIDRLPGDRPQITADARGQVVSRSVRMTGDGPEDGQTLCRYGQGVLAKGGFRVAHRPRTRPRFGLCQKVRPKLTDRPGGLQCISTEQEPRPPRK